MKIAVFPGSFDPLTYGHIDLVKRGLDLFDEVIVAVAKNPQKNYCFTVQERIDFWNHLGIARTRVLACQGLVAEFALANQACCLLKGVRDGRDLDSELAQARVNKKMFGVDTIWLPAAIEHSELSSSLVKELALFAAPVSEYVPEEVAAGLKRKFQLSECKKV